MNLEQRIYNGNRAKEILDNEVFQQVWTDIEQELIDAWKTSPQRDEEGRRRLFDAVTMLGKVKSLIQSTLETGVLAVKELEYLEKKKLSERLGIDSWKL